MPEISRREVLVGGIAAAGLLSAEVSANEASSTSWIDAHSHIWTPDTSRFRLQQGVTTDDLAPRSFDDRELMTIARPLGVERVVLIQHTLFHGFDNSYLVDAWRRHPHTFRVVGMVDDLRPNCGRAMRHLLQQGVTGFRITPRQGINDWLQTAGMTEMWQTAAKTRQPMCCLINSSDLRAVDAACRRHPETPVVIDHFARIGVDGTIRDADVAQLCKLSRYPYVKVKISAYYALGRRQAPHTELIPMIRRLFEAFGPQRLMWASDSPYQINEHNTYESSLALVRDHLEFVSDADRQKLLRTTAEETFFFA